MAHYPYGYASSSGYVLPYPQSKALVKFTTAIQRLLCCACHCFEHYINVFFVFYSNARTSAGTTKCA